MNRLRDITGRAFVALALTFLVAACAMFGVPNAETFNQKLAVGYSTVTTARETATSLLNLGDITVEDAENVQAQADVARQSLDVARAMYGNDPAAADAKLQAAMVGLNALSAYLRAKERR